MAQPTAPLAGWRTLNQIAIPNGGTRNAYKNINYNLLYPWTAP
jgi:hypothetical protein